MGSAIELCHEKTPIFPRNMKDKQKRTKTEYEINSKKFSNKETREGENQEV